jgi:hypothetical protein
MKSTTISAGNEYGVRSPAAVAARAIAAVHLLLNPATDELAVARLLVQHGESTSLVVTPMDLPELRTVATALDGLFDLDSVDDWARQLNALLATWASKPHLAHEGIGWHLHVDRGENASLAEWLASSSAMALALLLMRSGQPPVRRCAAHGCAQPFLLSTSGAPRRFCSTTCSTRTRVSNHRRRRSAQ